MQIVGRIPLHRNATAHMLTTSNLSGLVRFLQPGKVEEGKFAVVKWCTKFQEELAAVPGSQDKWLI